MDSHPTGSNRILEIKLENLYVVIKSKNSQPNLNNKNLINQASTLKISGIDIKSVKVCGIEKVTVDDDFVGMSFHNLKTFPLFFEQTDYEIIVQSKAGEAVSLWHENYSIREKVDTVTDSTDLISGIINFGNSAGFSEFEISLNGKKILVIRIEVFPSKISYKEDYQEMLMDISNEVYGAILDFMRNTYQEFSLGATQKSTPALFFEIINRVFEKFKRAANIIVKSPHHKLCIERPVVAAHKIKNIDNTTLNWLRKHPGHIKKAGSGYIVDKAPTVRKQITYNTIENQFTKFMLKTTIKRLSEFKDRYIRSSKNPEPAVITNANNMISSLNETINNSFLYDVDEYRNTQSMSLVFEMAPGYRELYKYYLMMQRGLNINGDVFRMSLKDTAQLYEYWCFIKLVSLMKKSYRLVSPDVIKIDNTGVTITLVKGRKSDIKFINPRTGERIVLSYNPGEQSTQTVNQRPDNVLTLDKRGSDVQYKYVFDAKYRIENNPSSSYYPDHQPGPKVDDINTMHRYRDSIVYENAGTSRFIFEKTMFGAYVLFPYEDPEKNYINHRFYKSIETVNIGGLPFLPGTTELVENFLAELIADSEESAFERASLPVGIEEKLAKVDWSVKDVLVGTVRSEEQLKYNIKNKNYYVPARFILQENLPIRYIALHEDATIGTPGVSRYGMVIETLKVRRKNIPVSMLRKNGDEQYYYFKIKEWLSLETPIVIKDTYRGKPQFTNKFLLDNCKDSYQLFSINSDEQYRLMQEVDKAFDSITTSSDSNNDTVYQINSEYSITVSEGYFLIMKIGGSVIEKIPIARFAATPRNTFNKIKKLVSN